MISFVKSKSDRSKPQRCEPDAAFVRRTITLPPEIDRELTATVGSGKFSAFVLRAVSHELQRERIERWLSEREAERGRPLDEEAVAFAEAAWRRRKRS